MMTKIMKYKQFYRRNLPHIQPEEAILFITYRLFFKLPDEYLNRVKLLKTEFQNKIRSVKKKNIESEKLKFEKNLFDYKDNFIGKFQNSPFWLKEDKIAKIIKDSLFWGSQKRYDLFAFCVMPNHVHILIRPVIIDDKPFPLQKIMYDHKHFTAIEANKLLKRKGNFWQDEHYDHYIRNENEFFNILNYIYLNPVKANLVENPDEWEFTYINEKLL